MCKLADGAKHVDGVGRMNGVRSVDCVRRVDGTKCSDCRNLHFLNKSKKVARTSKMTFRATSRSIVAIIRARAIVAMTSRATFRMT